MRIYILRHGETAYNAKKRYQGTRDIPLSEKGKGELRQADFSPNVVYVSSLCRTSQTAEVVFPHSELVVEHDLREMCFGIFEGRNFMEMEKDPEYLAWVGADCMGRCPGGETRREFTERTCAVFERLMQEALANGEEVLVILAHGGTQMALMEQYALPKKDYYHWCSPNAGGYMLETTTEEWNTARTMRYIEEVQYIKKEVQT